MNKIKKLNKPKLLNKINDNKPKPPYLTQNILYSKFNKTRKKNTTIKLKQSDKDKKKGCC